MKLLTKAIKAVAPPVAYNASDDALIVAKFFHPLSSYTFYMTELDSDGQMAYGYVMGLAVDEFGPVSMRELKSVSVYGMGIERELYFPINEHRVADVKEGRVS